ncbi:MAG TPA: hypothetical protein VG370_11250 [Chloroflexota bacterium]|jgi:hypothetical protein|nr:hypothetical protein [Chloroflexota bacterium]
MHVGDRADDHPPEAATVFETIAPRSVPVRHVESGALAFGGR